MSTKPELSIAFVLDGANTLRAAKEEQSLYEQALTRILPNHQLHFTSTNTFTPGICCDCLVFDYGGMMQAYNSPFYAYCRGVSQYAIDNPNTLVIIASSFSYQFGIAKELERMGLFDEFLAQPGVWSVPTFGDNEEVNEVLRKVVPNMLYARYFLSEDYVEQAITSWFRPTRLLTTTKGHPKI